MRQARCIHAIQDCFAHGNVNPLAHGYDSVTWKLYYDNPSFKPWRVSATRNTTVSLPRSFSVKVGLPHRRR
jgi:hypothetical protein